MRVEQLGLARQRMGRRSNGSVDLFLSHRFTDNTSSGTRRRPINRSDRTFSSNILEYFPGSPQRRQYYLAENSSEWSSRCRDLGARRSKLKYLWKLVKGFRSWRRWSNIVAKPGPWRSEACHTAGKSYELFRDNIQRPGWYPLQTLDEIQSTKRLSL